MSLKGAPESVLAAFLAGLSSRAAELLKDDLETLGNVRRADLERARAEVVQTALRLEAEGKIDLGREDDG
jgi:flagellar motor switch protein FliG